MKFSCGLQKPNPLQNLISIIYSVNSFHIILGINGSLWSIFAHSIADLKCIQLKTESDGLKLNALIRSLRVDSIENYVTFCWIESSNPIVFSFVWGESKYRIFRKILVDKFPRKTILFYQWDTKKTLQMTHKRYVICPDSAKCATVFNYRVCKCFDEFYIYLVWIWSKKLLLHFGSRVI